MPRVVNRNAGVESISKAKKAALTEFVLNYDSKKEEEACRARNAHLWFDAAEPVPEHLKEQLGVQARKVKPLPILGNGQILSLREYRKLEIAREEAARGRITKAARKPGHRASRKRSRSSGEETDASPVGAASNKKLKTEAPATSPEPAEGSSSAWPLSPSDTVEPETPTSPVDTDSEDIHMTEAPPSPPEDYEDRKSELMQCHQRIHFLTGPQEIAAAQLVKKLGGRDYICKDGVTIKLPQLPGEIRRRLLRHLEETF